MLLKSIWSPNFRKNPFSIRDNFLNARCITEGTQCCLGTTDFHTVNKSTAPLALLQSYNCLTIVNNWLGNKGRYFYFIL